MKTAEAAEDLEKANNYVRLKMVNRFESSACLAVVTGLLHSLQPGNQLLREVLI